MKTSRVFMIVVAFLAFAGCSETIVEIDISPPFSGTIFIDPDIITDADPSVYSGMTYAGRASRTMFDRRNKLSTQVDNDARKFFEDKVYKTVIPRNVRLSEAPSHGVPILIYDKLCAGSISYSSFCDEFLKQENLMESAA